MSRNKRSKAGVSRKLRKRMTRLVWVVGVSADPSCEVEQNPLRHRYPDTNYGIRFTCDSKEKRKKVEDTVVEALKRRNIVYSVSRFIDVHPGEYCIEITPWGYEEVLNKGA